jgi:ribonuclease T2
MLARILGTVTLGLTLTACQPDTAGSIPQGESFDFYVLSLSWSPTYCEIEGDRANRQQCGSRQNYDFIVHGLWPQFERGWPEYCGSREPERVPNDIVRTVADIMPTAGLVGHQWRKHGSCAGLRQTDYFSAVRSAWDKIEIPDTFENTRSDLTIAPNEVEKAFLKANPGLPANGIAVSCQNRMISEVRICLTKSLEFRSCTEIDQKACRIPSASLPASGG